MRKFLSSPIYLLAIAFFLMGTTLLFSQNFEGKITYATTYENLPDELKGMESLLPKESCLYLRQNLSRLETPLMGGHNTLIYDYENHQGLLLMNMQGIKWAIKISPEDTVGFAQQKPLEIIYLEEHQEIAGYLCQKVITRSQLPDGTTKEQTLYVTNEIKGYHRSFKYLKGIPLAYDDFQNGIKINIRASEVKETVITDHTFDLSVPIGYDEKTMKEITQMQRN